MKYGEEQSLVESSFKKVITKLFGCTHLGERSRHNYLMDGLQFINLPKNAEVLNAGSANGAHSFYLAWRFPGWHITGIDIDSEMVKRSLKINELLRFKNVDFFQKDIGALEERDRFDLVFSISVMQFIQDQERAFSSLYNVLKPHGYLILNVPSLPRPPRLSFLGKERERFHQSEVLSTKTYDNNELSLLVAKAGFKILKLYNPSGLYAQLAWELSSILEGKEKRRLLFYPFLLFLIYLDKLQKNEKPFPAGTDCLVIAQK